jgi:hypothetical protein
MIQIQKIILFNMIEQKVLYFYAQGLYRDNFSKPKLSNYSQTLRAQMATQLILLAKSYFIFTPIDRESIREIYYFLDYSSGIFLFLRQAEWRHWLWIKYYHFTFFGISEKDSDFSPQSLEGLGFIISNHRHPSGMQSPLNW